MSKFDTDTLRRLIERPKVVSHWGTNYRITPRLVDAIFGDGLKLIAIYPINHRPNHYVVRIDSTWNTSNWGEGPVLIDHLDDIYDAIEEEFGISDVDGFPCADFSCGSSWSEQWWPGERENGWRQEELIRHFHGAELAESEAGHE